MRTQTEQYQFNNSQHTNQVEIFQLEDVSVIFDKIKALDSVRLSIKKGEIIFVTGASGAGKSTLLKVMSSQIRPTLGRVKILSHPKHYPLFISQVFQDLRLIQNSSCEDNINHAYDSSLYNTKKEFKNDRDQLCNILGVSDRLHLKINEANGGLKQKIAIIRGLLARPDVLILDEPSASLDFENSKKIFDLLNLFNVRRGMTIIWASHNRDLVKNFSGRIIHLDKGKIIHSGHACFI